jgi:hypothetical protein
MDKHLIIDVRRNLPLRRRMGSDLATAAVWGGWVMLVFNSFPGAAHARPALAHAAAARLPALTINPLWLLAGFVVAVLWTAPPPVPSGEAGGAGPGLRLPFRDQRAGAGHGARGAGLHGAP